MTSPIVSGFTPISPRNTEKRGSYFVSVASALSQLILGVDWPGSSLSVDKALVR